MEAMVQDRRADAERRQNEDAIFADAAGLYERYVELASLGRFTADAVAANEVTRWTPQPLGLAIGGPRWDIPLDLRLTRER